jgi:carbon storage regulator
MLVLSRKVGERICIGDGIVITIVSTRGKQVQVGIEAPRHVPVLREELVARPAQQEPPADEPLAVDKPSRRMLAGVLCHQKRPTWFSQ